MKKRILAGLLAGAMVFSLAACGAGGNSDKGDGLIKVGIINNDPSESGYRTANVYAHFRVMLLMIGNSAHNLVANPRHVSNIVMSLTDCIE